MTATRNNLRAATAALSGAAIVLLAAILLAIRPIPAFAEGDQVVLDIPTEVPCVVKADGSVVAPSPEAWTIKNTSGSPVILGKVTITPGEDAGPIGLSASATPYNGNAACGDQFDWFSYGRGQNVDHPSAEQTLEAGNSLQVAWSIDKLDSVNNREAIEGSTKADGFAFANIQFSFKKKEPKAFAVIYDDGNGGRAAKLYKRPNVPAVGDMFEGDLATDVITGIENMRAAFKDNGGKKLTAVAVVDDGIQPLTMNDWFVSCTGLASADLGKLDPSKTKDMSGMFYKCSSLTELDLSGWNTAASEGSQTVKSTKNVTDMGFMFYGCSGLASLDLSNFNTGNVTDMGYMFNGCSGLASLDVSNFNTGNVTDMGDMFNGCSRLASLDVSNFNTGNVKSMNYMFGWCSGIASLDLSNFNTGNVKSMNYMFGWCSGIASLDLSNFNTGNVKSMNYMFGWCSGIASLDLSNFNTGNVMYMGDMFNGCSRLASLDVSNFNTGNVKSMGGMFNGCSGLASLDVSNFNTGNVKSMGGMFNGCSGLASLDVSNFNTGNVKSMGGMFNGCSGLASLDVSNFNTGNVKKMSWMFSRCSGLASLDLSNFNTGNVTDMGGMFYQCSGLASLNVSNFNTGNVKSMNYMFNGCKKLTTVSLPIDSNSSAKLQEALKKDGVILQSSQRTISEDASGLSAPDGMESRQLGEGAENRSFEPAGSESLSGSTASAAAIAPSPNVSNPGKTEADSPGQSGDSDSKEPSVEKAGPQPDPDGNFSLDKSGSSAQEK